MFLVDADCHPQTIEVVRTRAEPLGIEVVVGDPDARLPVRRTCFGCCCSIRAAADASVTTAASIARAHEQGALVAVAADLLALTLLVPPGEMGADVVVGSSQRFGVPLGFGGPHAAFLATRDEYKRTLPGRLVGVSIDARGPHRVPARARRHASSTSGGRRRRATSAPRRCCSR